MITAIKEAFPFLFDDMIFRIRMDCRPYSSAGLYTKMMIESPGLFLQHLGRGKRIKPNDGIEIDIVRGETK